MTIGALGAYGFQPYVYNTNAVSAASMNKLSKISDDVLDKKVDYSELADESKNVNPLKKGQTLDFQSMLQMQMQRGQNNAARIMKPAQNLLRQRKSRHKCLRRSRLPERLWCSLVRLLMRSQRLRQTRTFPLTLTITAAIRIIRCSRQLMHMRCL